ncbi:transcriptional regulator with XRE-family HTH domain [Geodermatophilus bullaregiensis]|uniref:hypothetical protein n=1 Tax=Geodermatophilus bullaregiensis TaxID=1564160 RepID=UPI001958057B|nr:hypothetical protein [Geodermatophilus bullaregiensis]MBM7805010.1 transcriptional regulator with XRE-family HTH domain [Geodermatophilus bullaregiensis]
MPDRDLGDLIRRRLLELRVTAAQIARRSGGLVPAETVRGLARGQRIRVGDRLARALARALQVTEYRVRRAAGLPMTEAIGEPTRPHLRIVRGGAQTGR